LDKALAKESANATAALGSTPGEIGAAPNKRHQSPTPIWNDSELIGNQGNFMAAEGNFVAVESDSKLAREPSFRRGMTRRETAGDMKKTQSISHRCLVIISDRRRKVRRREP
jgi:hypothetical protein